MNELAVLKPNSPASELTVRSVARNSRRHVVQGRRTDGVLEPVGERAARHAGGRREFRHRPRLARTTVDQRQRGAQPLVAQGPQRARRHPAMWMSRPHSGIDHATGGDLTPLPLLCPVLRRRNRDLGELRPPANHNSPRSTADARMGFDKSRRVGQNAGPTASDSYIVGLDLSNMDSCLTCQEGRPACGSTAL
jgi:hypothetical protein